ncbi:MAG: TolB family protein, partial [Gemmatimonadaceae bacterium]
MFASYRRAAFLALLSIVAALPLGAQTVAQQGWNPQQILRTETFVKPPADVEHMIMTPRTDITFTSPSPDRKWFLKAIAADRGDIDAYGKSHVNLGGLQIDTKANRARTVTTSTRTGLMLVDPRTNATKTLDTPKGATLWAQTWSPNGMQVAYIASFDDASQIFVADVATGKSTQVTKTPLNATLVTCLEWTADGKNIVTVLVPDVRGPVPTHGKNGVEDGPEVRLTDSRALPQVIHPSLLEDPHDKALLAYYATAQLAVIDVKAKTVRKVGGRGGGDLGGGPVGRGGQQAASDTGKRNIQWNPVGQGLVYMQSVFAGGAPMTSGRAAGRGQQAQRPQPTSVRYVNWTPPFGPSDTKVVYEG